MQRAFGAPPKGGKRPSKRAKARFFTLGGGDVPSPLSKTAQASVFARLTPLGGLAPRRKRRFPLLCRSKKKEKSG